MKTPSILFYAKQTKLNNQVIQDGIIEEKFFEIFDLIQEFQSTDDFASWITNQKFEHVVYKNEIKEGSYSRDWQYTFEKASFLWGKSELEEKKIPKDLRDQLLCLNRIFYGTEQPLRIEKVSIHSILTEFHYTVISHIIYKELVIGSLWEIYNFSILLKLYEQKKDPMRYWRKMRRE